jgi:hypothetical protein
MAVAYSNDPLCASHCPNITQVANDAFLRDAQRYILQAIMSLDGLTVNLHEAQSQETLRRPRHSRGKKTLHAVELSIRTECLQDLVQLSRRPFGWSTRMTRTGEVISMTKNLLSF